MRVEGLANVTPKWLNFLMTTGSDDSETDLAPREHEATRMAALSFDSAVSPPVTLRAVDRQRTERAYGWGFAWYPEGGPSAAIVKDPTSLGENAMTHLLSDWDRFRSTTFVCHLRGAARTLPEQDTHPFGRVYGGRTWVLAHNGDLNQVEPGALARALPLDQAPGFEPMGRTDSERALCWLINQAAGAGARNLADVGYPRLHEWFQYLDSLGTANFIVSDGHDLAVYGDQDSYNQLWTARFLPPNIPRTLETPDLLVGLDDAIERYRTVLVFSTLPLCPDGFRPLDGGQLLVARRGSIVFDSTANSEGAFSPGPIVSPLNSGQGPVVARQTMPPESTLGLQTSASGMLDAEAAVAGDSREVEVPALHHHASVLGVGRLLRVEHETTYRYDKPVERSVHVLRLEPIHDAWQDLLRFELDFSAAGTHRRYTDVFQNVVLRVDVEQPYTELRIVARSLVSVRMSVRADLHSPSRRFTIPLVWMPWQRQMMTPYLLPPELPETQLNALSEFAMSFVERQDFDLVQTLLDMNTTIFRDFSYVSGSTTMATTPFQVFTQRRGVCQDFANLLICMARLLGVPARYRVGYIHTGNNYENRVQSDASHAWAELYLPWTGWVGFDPTNGTLANADHVRVASGRNFQDATPTSGTIYRGGGLETLSVAVRVEDVEQAPSLPASTSAE